MSEETHELLRKLAVATGEPMQRSSSERSSTTAASSSSPSFPFTTRRRGLSIHVEVRPPDGGLRDVSFAMCEQVRSLPVNRLGPHPSGSVSPALLSSVENRLRLLLGL